MHAESDERNGFGEFWLAFAWVCGLFVKRRMREETRVIFQQVNKGIPDLTSNLHNPISGQVLFLLCSSNRALPADHS